MTERTLTVTAAARNFADVVNRVYYRNESALLVKNGTAVARIVPIAPVRRSGGEVAELMRKILRLSPEDAKAFADDIEAARRVLPPPPGPWG